MAKITAKQVLDLAGSQIGIKATDIKRCKYNKWYYGADVSGSGYDWCLTFIQWIFNQLGASDMLYTKTANCGAQGQAFNNKGKLVKSGYKAGDIVFFHWDNDTSNWVSGVYSLDHVGIIESVNADGSVVTIEGNTGDTSNGEVMRRTRKANVISCAGRPDYAVDDNSSESEVETVEITMQVISKSNKTNRVGQVLTLQRILNELKNGEGYRGKDGKKLTLDGDFGDNTEYALKAYQTAHKLTVDGICGQKSWSSLLCEVPT